MSNIVRINAIFYIIITSILYSTYIRGCMATDRQLNCTVNGTVVIKPYETCKINNNTYGQIKISYQNSQQCYGSSETLCSEFECCCNKNYISKNKKHKAVDYDYSLKCFNSEDAVWDTASTCIFVLTALIIIFIFGLGAAARSDIHETTRETCFTFRRHHNQPLVIEIAHKPEKKPVLNNRIQNRPLKDVNTLCGISLEYIPKNMKYYKCVTCEFVCNAELFNKWYQVNKICPGCRLDLKDTHMNSIIYLNSKK